MNHLTILLIAFCLFYTSCKKEDNVNNNNNNNNSSNANVSADFMPLAVGNYWVYEWYEIDSNGVEAYYNKRDSVYISKDTIINSNTYYKKEGTFLGSYEVFGFVRDSNDYIVNSEGKIQFSSTNFTDILRTDTFENVAYIDYKMAHKDSSITVPSGIFTTYDFEGKVYDFDSLYQAQWGTQYIHNLYADSIGLVLEETFYHSQPYNKLQKRLVKYHAQ